MKIEYKINNDEEFLKHCRSWEYCDDFMFLKKERLNDDMIHASKFGFVKSLEFLIDAGADSWNYGIITACGFGHIKVVLFLMKKGESYFSSQPFVWNCCLASACSCANIFIIKLMIEKGATNFDEGMRNTCLKGHVNVVNLMIKHGATDWNNGMIWACEKGNTEIIKLMIKKGATDFVRGMNSACNSDHMNIVRLMISHINQNTKNESYVWTGLRFKAKEFVDSCSCKELLEYLSFHFPKHIRTKIKDRIKLILFFKIILNSEENLFPVLSSFIHV